MKNSLADLPARNINIGRRRYYPVSSIQFIPSFQREFSEFILLLPQFEFVPLDFSLSASLVCAFPSLVRLILGVHIFYFPMLATLVLIIRSCTFCFSSLVSWFGLMYCIVYTRKDTGYCICMAKLYCMFALVGLWSV